MSAALVAVPVLLATIPAAAAPTGTGSISGRVVDGSGTPLSGICVDVDGGPGTQSDGVGAYNVTGLDTGAYKLRFTDCNPAPVYSERWYLNRPDASSADPIAVMDGFDSPTADVTLESGISVSGTVTDTNGTPLAGISVNLSPVGPSASPPGTQTDSNGVYTTTPVAPGDYRVQFADHNPGSVLAPTFWHQKPSWNTADILSLEPIDGPTHPGIDAQLSVGATVEGTVTGPDGNALAGICVDANVPSNGGWDWVGGTQTGSMGEYSLSRLPAVDTRIRFRNCQNGPYTDQWYGAQPNIDSSTPVVLAPGEVRQGVDAQMDAGVQVSGTVTDEDGNPISGISVNVNPEDSGANASAQTDTAGHYVTSALPPGSYRVEFRDWSPNPQWAGEYWDDQLSQRTATTLTIAPGDPAVRTDINATLARGASVTGTVTKPDGGPAAGVCVIAVVETADGPDWIGSADTVNDGTYRINGLPATETRIVFQDCHDRGPYAEEWWNDQRDYDNAETLTLASGTTQTGIDAQLAAAGQINGRVTDENGDPLEGICVQSSTDTFVGSTVRTRSDGRYAITVSQPGQYRVQFVDCSETPKFAGEWWDNQATPAAASLIAVAPGEIVGHVDAELAEGAVSTVSGRVTNLHGVPVTSACVVVYLPDQYALFAPVGSDGTFSVANVPSGTYAIAFLGCADGGEPNEIIQDPQSAGTTYRAVWWDGETVQIANGNSGPDPIAQGANLVTVAPGADLTGYDWCFGCTAISIGSIEPSSASVTFAFTTPGLLPAGVQSLALTDPQGGVSPAASGYQYTVTCTSTNGGATGTGSGTSSPITVAGLTPGKTYSCQVTASDGSLTVAASAEAVVVLSASANGTAAVPVSDLSQSAGAQMARTGADSGVQVRLGAVLLALGLVLIALSRARRPRASILR